jgi:hypothetical protein
MVVLVWAMTLCTLICVDDVLARFPEACHLFRGYRFWRGVQRLGADDRGSIGAGLSRRVVGAQGMLLSVHDCSVREFGARVPFPNVSHH